jgi:flagellar hook-associated protein 2
MSTTVSSTTSSYSSTNRITGLVSGVDTDSLVEQLMEVEEQELERLVQKQQLVEWEQEAYREVSNTLRAFCEEYFDYSNSSTNMLSQSTYQQFSTSSSDETVVTTSSSSDSEIGSHTITVENLATAASYESSSGVTKTITASSTVDYTEAAGLSFVIEIDGTEYIVELNESISNIGDLQTAIDKAAGSGKIEVSDTNGDGTGYLTISKVDGSGIGIITLDDGDDDALSALGFSDNNNLTNYLDTSETLEEISEKLENPFSFDSDGNINLTINGVSFEFSQSTTLDDMMDEINNSDAGVTMEYNSTTDSFSITANNTGAGNTLSISETLSTFLEDIVITNYTAGEDAIATIDGEKVTRSSNTFSLDGITYNLKSESTEEQTISVTQDTNTICETIKSFVEDYNSLIENINSIISEEYDRDYQPLTDDEKAEMSDDEIKAWEEKSKTGILEDDSILSNLLSNMRTALYESVGGTYLMEIGITTSSNYEDKGKLEIDEDDLRTAIESDPEKIMNLFTQESKSYSGTTTVRKLSLSEREVRSSEEGLAYRLYDILQDNISTYSDLNGNKGLLIEKAGLEGDSSNYDNTLTAQIGEYDEQIEEMEEKLSDREDYYYEKFSYMETYINQMNNQINALLSYLE